MASVIPRRATTWPKPRPPSTTARVGASMGTVMVGVTTVSPAFTDATYCGTRMTPCESWPRRFARTRSVAIHAASSRGTPSAAKILRVVSSSVPAARIGIAGRLLDVTEERHGFVRVGVSACLLGERVRWDGGDKRDAFLTDILGPFVEWVAVCPEVEIGLGTPREPIRLVSLGAGVARLVAQTSGADVTRGMERFAETKARALAALGLDGYVLKRASPSCGLFEVPIHGDGGEPPQSGRGVYAALLARRLPTLPMEEEGRLLDKALREHFIERLFTGA